ncbi:hypothetical protein PFLUV_G00169280 [Perca fluviatilis]|uniref:LTD domain-containing protein n=1 Tax=Perca fluviatilis TaxID=8168 RepID=A0A6A5EJ64_PERFL|nr:hypothetical protein PFLUV_G00169280 [Perca fluviatilis]
MPVLVTRPIRTYHWETGNYIYMSTTENLSNTNSCQHSNSRLERLSLSGFQVAKRWCDTSTDLVWKDQTSWGTGKQLLVSLYSSTGELEARKISEGRIIVNEVDPEGKYVRLTNKSNKDKPLGGWELHLQINNRKPSMFTSFDSFILKAGETVTIWASGCCVNDNSPTDLVWKDQKPWDTGEQLRVSLYSCNGEVMTTKEVGF